MAGTGIAGGRKARNLAWNSDVHFTQRGGCNLSFDSLGLRTEEAKNQLFYVGLSQGRGPT